jgi:hypothetical protein
MKAKQLTGLRLLHQKGRGAADRGQHRKVAGARQGSVIKLATSEGGGTMLRKTIYAMPIVILMLGAASAQTDKQGVPGYTDPLRTDLEKKNDRELDRAYESTVKGRPDAKQNSDPWADVRSAPPAAAKNKQK